jgi:hypothetical protein
MEFIMSLKINCAVCRGTKKVDKIGGYHTKECPNCKGLGKVDKHPLEDTGFDPVVIVNVLEAEVVEPKPQDPKEDKIEPTLTSKEGKSKNGKGK